MKKIKWMHPRTDTSQPISFTRQKRDGAQMKKCSHFSFVPTRGKGRLRGTDWRIFFSPQQIKLQARIYSQIGRRAAG